jgi:hypothetical protein
VLGASGGAAVAIGLLIVLYVVVGIGGFVMMIVALVDIVRRPDWQWKLSGQEKIVWLLVIILVNVFAIPSLIYWFNIRKKLIAVDQAAASGQYGPGYMTYGGWAPGPPIPGPNRGMAPAGWHPDPSGEHGLRWWDGSSWTEHTWSGSAPAGPSPTPGG